jgi:L-ribulokinase
MAAAVVSGIHKDLASAQKTMGSGFEKVYKPDPQNAAIYTRLYEKYIKLGEAVEKLNS